MNPMIISVVAAVIKEAVDLGPTIIKAAENARPFAEKIVDIFDGREITQEELDQLLVSAKALSSQLQAPYTGGATTA